MPFHSVIVCNAAGMTLLARHWDPRITSSLDESKYFEAALYQNTSPYWGFARMRQSVSFMDVHSVFMTVNDLILFVSGTNDVEELQLSEVLNLIIEIMKSNFEAIVSEAQLLVAGNIGKICVCIDEAISDGILETTDLDTINKMAKLKSFV